MAHAHREAKINDAIAVHGSLQDRLARDVLVAAHGRAKKSTRVACAQACARLVHKPPPAAAALHSRPAVLKKIGQQPGGPVRSGSRIRVRSRACAMREGVPGSCNKVRERRLVAGSAIALWPANARRSTASAAAQAKRGGP